MNDPAPRIATQPTPGALHEVDPDMLVNVEHEDVELGRIEGLEVAADVLLQADAALTASLDRA